MKVLNLGSLNIDYVYDVDHFVRAGETQGSLNMETFCGGKGLNQSIALSRSGIEVWHGGAVGFDDSKMLLDTLAAAGVRINLINRKNSKSGHAIIQKVKSGENCILLHGGANHMITKEDVAFTLGNFQQGDYIILQNEISELPYIMESAHKKGMKVVFNPSPISREIMDYPLEYVDYFILNEIEAADICDGHGLEGSELIEKLHGLFPESKIVLTLGEKGSIYKDSEKIYHQPIFKVKAVDTTAAGDTFTGFFIGALVSNKGVEDSLEIAAKASAISVTRNGASVSIPTLEEVVGHNWSNGDK
ncbi:ribokinase [Clostridium culturomicium]|uniref:ribokinase n=1 Tax=Clostridium culturomicium TaxID=1499683 RepID=UPI00058E3D57|nr:ribokinase [Clostridium culturomicium]